MLDPHRAGIEWVRLLEHQLPTWPLIKAMSDVNDEAEVERIAHDDDVPFAAIRATVAFYRENHAAFDTSIDTLRLTAGSTDPTGAIRSCASPSTRTSWSTVSLRCALSTTVRSPPPI